MTLQEYIVHMLEDRENIRESIRIIRQYILAEPVNRDDVIEGL